jgi:UDP-3-O-[3-hydroxymyristoyl] glucosamine N-acyltransferase
MRVGLEAEVLDSRSRFDIESILSDLGLVYEIKGRITNFKSIKNVAALDEATPNDLTFCSKKTKNALIDISQSNGGVILHDKIHSEVINANPNQLLISVENPRLVFMHLANRIYHSKSNFKQGISRLSFISKNSSIGKNCAVGNFSSIDDDCTVGDNTIVGDRVSLKNCVIGDNCIIQSGIAIGEDGFAYERNNNTILEAFPHYGKVIIGNNVEISTNCSIARGSLKDTIIRNGTKIDALVHIAHNVVIGKNCGLTAGTIIGGSTTIGDTCWLGLNCTLKHKINLGNKVIVGSGASVINDVPDEDIIAGVPAKSIKHKVNSDQLFLMAGHKTKPTQTEKKGNLLHY